MIEEERRKLKEIVNADGEVSKDEFVLYARNSDFFKNQVKSLSEDMKAWCIIGACLKAL